MTASGLPASLARVAAGIVQSLRSASVFHVKALPRGVMTHKFEVHAGAACYIVRFYPRTREKVVCYEPDLLRRCREAGARVPLVIGDSRSGPDAPLPYVVYEKLPGQPLRDCFSALSLVRRRALAEALVAELALLRTVVFAGYGDLLNGTTARWATWQEFVELTVQEGVQAVQSFNLLPPHMKAALLRLSEKIHELTVPACPELNWGDVNMENILVDEAGRLTGLVDFEGALSGDALLTLGYALAFYGWSCFVEALTLAWPEPLKASARRRVEFYAVFRALRSAPYYAHPLLPNGARRMPLAEIYPGLEGALESLAKA